MEKVFEIPGEDEYRDILGKVDIREKAQVKCGACSSCSSSCGGTTACR